MSRQVVLLPEAESDLDAAYWWYEERDAGLGDEYLRCVEEAFARIAANPLLYPRRFDDSRRILIRRFPYAIYFEHDEETVTVQFVFHCAQDPVKLDERLRENS